MCTAPPHRTHIVHRKETHTHCAPQACSCGAGDVPEITGPGSPKAGSIAQPTGIPGQLLGVSSYPSEKQANSLHSAFPQVVVVWPRRCAICKGTLPPPLPTGHVALSLQPECVVAFWHIIYLGSPSPPSLSGYIDMHLG